MKGLIVALCWPFKLPQFLMFYLSCVSKFINISMNRWQMEAPVGTEINPKLLSIKCPWGKEQKEKEREAWIFSKGRKGWLSNHSINWANKIDQLRMNPFYSLNHVNKSHWKWYWTFGLPNMVKTNDGLTSWMLLSFIEVRTNASLYF